MTGFAWLAAAICAEVAGTLALKGSIGMTRPLPAVLVVGATLLAAFAEVP
jgi:multidrug transporter EmrE-like cation transporter